MKNIVTIGGGTGSYTVLSGLKHLEDVSLTALVSMADNGGSTGMLMDELGVLPAGDIRQCLVALSEHREIVRKLMNYRFSSGKLSGHNFGNIFLAALEKVTGDFTEGVEIASEILKVRGKVIPITKDKAKLYAKVSNGKILEGEVNITNFNLNNLFFEKIFYKDKVYLNNSAKNAIRKADYIIIGPGEYFSSIIPNLIVAGFKNALIKSKAKVILIVNLTNKQNHTLNWGVSDYVKNTEKFIQKKVDIILVNNKRPSKIQEKIYKLKKGDGVMVRDDFFDNRVIRQDLISYIIPQKLKVDVVKRSFIRHDSKKVANSIEKIIRENNVKIIFDFDDTLFDTKKLKENVYSYLEKEGISKNKSKKYHKDIRSFDTSFSLKVFLYSIFKKEKKEIFNIEKIYQNILKTCSNLVNKDVLEIAKNIGKENCYIVTDGDEEFQKDKIRNAGINSMFSQIIVVQGSKKKIIEEICIENKDKKIIFIDDKKKFFDDLDMKLCKNLKTILFTKNNISEIKKEIFS